jgi:hypothetical protein
MGRRVSRAETGESWDWADEAKALDSYARQVNDDSMHKMADRIQGRAVRRAGELLQEITPQSGARGPAHSYRCRKSSIVRNAFCCSSSPDLNQAIACRASEIATIASTSVKLWDGS